MSSASSPLLPHDATPFVTSSFLWSSGATLVAAGMTLGAFGAHALKGRPGITADNVHAWDTATNYLIVNGLGLLLVSQHPRFSSHHFAGCAILCGGAVFSGSIMSLILCKKLRFLGPITPLGGIIMISGYISLVF
ncbi:hypothetical protein SCLCIDRAFT_1210731 [Scleroderma citrinum Foug A]|uniref:DUF423-domain-containing protein n=1 Tax=Scleroderma citrinum Foug A TaxID=1036808 RepID=A0A0C3EFZ1_9AGAM|nr:hypothetical protein SCLCIDRAFT_1210731 [Scleroderma citrinum Foug A]